MAGKKGSRSSKTDHVLSLLAGGAPENAQPASEKPEAEQPAAKKPAAEKSAAEKPAAEKPAAEKAAPEKPDVQQSPAPAAETARPAPARATLPPILEVARANNEALSEAIRDALTENLEQELARAEEEPPVEEPPAPEEIPVPEEISGPVEAPAPEAIPLSEMIPVPEMARVPEIVPAPVVVSAAEEEPPAPAKVPVPQAPPAPAPGPGRSLPDGSVCLNVMELLVEERLDKYIRLFGLCDCPRCRADVQALALSRLQPKYVVLPSSAVSPMLSMYQAKFDSTVIAQVIYACKAVMESPRHTT